MGISTRRYLPANGTAGLARSLVNGNRRVPWPPPMITESTLLVFTDWRPVCDIINRARSCGFRLFIIARALRAQDTVPLFWPAAMSRLRERRASQYLDTLPSPRVSLGVSP